MSIQSEIVDVRRKSEPIKAVEFNEKTVPLLLANGWLAGFDMLASWMVGWLRPNPGTNRRTKVQPGEIIVAHWGEPVGIDGSGEFHLLIARCDDFDELYEPADSGLVTILNSAAGDHPADIEPVGGVEP